LLLGKVAQAQLQKPPFQAQWDESFGVIREKVVDMAVSKKSRTGNLSFSTMQPIKE